MADTIGPYYSGAALEAARSELPRIEDILEGGTIMQGAGEPNAKFVLTAAMVRAIMYVLLGGIGAYVTAVMNGDGQQHAIYKGIGAAVAAAILRLGAEGTYDALRANGKLGGVQPSDVAAFKPPLPPSA